METLARSRGVSQTEVPLSFAQQRLWRLERLTPGNPFCRTSTAWILDGCLDRGVLERSFQEIVRRHEVLRTTFPSPDGRPVQLVHPPSSSRLSLPEVDLTGLAPDRRRAEARRRMAEVAQLPFDPARGPMLRVLLVESSSTEHFLLISLHAMVADGDSVELLQRELAALYDPHLTADRPPLGELPIQYADFAVWQRQRWQGERLREHLAFWQRELAEIPVLEFPSDRPRGAACPSRQRYLRLPDSLCEELRRLDRRQEASLYLTLLAGFVSLLHRFTGQRDLVIGSPFANRPVAELEDLIGCFVNLLILRVELEDDFTFRQLLLRVRQVWRAASAHRELPCEKVLEELEPERYRSPSAFCQVTFAVGDRPSLTAELRGLRTRPLDLESGRARFDLELYVRDRAEGLTVEAEYDAGLFDASTIERMLRQYEEILAAAAADADLRLSALPLLSASGRHQLLTEWNDTAAVASGTLRIHQAFEAWVDKTPDAPAVIFSEEELSYRQLNEAANRLAHHLRALGVGPGRWVGVWMERSAQLIVALLGILKAGGAYLPLDSHWPEQRLRWVLDALGASCLVTCGPRLRTVHGMWWSLPQLVDVVCLDVATAEPPPEELDGEAVRTFWDQLAERASDRTTAGGFVSSYTGQPFTAAEVDEYRDRVVEMAAPYLGSGQRVLEIGCGAGLIMWELAPRVGSYTGIDPSALTQERNRRKAVAEGYGNVELRTGFAHQLGDLAAGPFDLILLASTIQFFPGPVYLGKVIAAALDLLAAGGALIVADVPDAGRKEEFRRSLEEFAHRHSDEAQVRTKRQLEEELYLAEGFFQELMAPRADVADLRVCHRLQGFANELRYRYDVVVEKCREGAAGQSRAPRKRLWTRHHLAPLTASDPPATTGGDDVAYAIFTSGTTGVPKGVVVQHAPVVNMMDWINRELGTGPGDQLLFVTSVCFDLSVYDVFGTLGAGATVRVAAAAELADPRRLASVLLEEPITLWDSAPAALEQLVPFLPAAAPDAKALRCILLSGDWIPTGLPDRLRAAFLGARVLSLGGATEATVWSNYYRVREVDPRWSSIPYGRPIANARYHVLDRRFEPCPIGVAGDLYIGDRCLALGYADPAATAKQFLPDPFGAPGDRLYDTGDRARYGADGNLELLGRRDHQVKVRGFRIELSEIETVLARHRSVQQAVVLVREDRPGDRRLVAYVVGETVDSAELRGHLTRKLPDYMVPAVFVPLSVLPLTSNGKVDRRALPAPEQVCQPRDHGIAPPSGPLEEKLAGWWSELLGVERVGRDDHFLELGGHSLLIGRLVARIRERLQAEISIAAFLESPTVAGLAEQLMRSGALASGSGHPLPPLVPIDRSGDLPLSFSQQRVWYLAELARGNIAYNTQVALDFRGPLDPGALHRAVTEIVRRHEILRTAFQLRDGRPVERVQPPLLVALPRIDLRALPAARRAVEVGKLALADARTPFDPARVPLVRWHLLRLADDEHRLLQTEYHLVHDGWSLAVLQREIKTLYNAFVAGGASPLPSLPIQFGDFAVWQRRWLRGPVLEPYLAYWRDRLEGSPPALEIPCDRPRPSVQSFRGAVERNTLPVELYRTLRRFARQRATTPFMVALGAFVVLLHRLSGQRDLVLGSTVANRRHRDSETILGMLVNNIALRFDLSGDPRGTEFLDQVRTVTLGAYTYEDLPFDRLVEELQPQREAGRNPIFQHMFSFHDSPMPRLDFAGLTTTLHYLHNGSAKFDLDVVLIPRGEQLVGRQALNVPGETEDETVRSIWEYCIDLFDATTIRRMMRYFEILLGQITSDPARRLSELALLPAVERAQLLREWNDTQTAPPAAAAVQELIAARAACAPDTAAVVAGRTVLSYRELDRRADRLAHHLRGLGIGPECRVAVCLERSPEMLVALLAVLKAGGVYLPLDPGYPAKSLDLRLRDAGVGSVLTRRALLADLPINGREAILVDELDALGAPVPSAAPPAGPHPDQLAYLIYTSGSTGRPKGIGISHRALLNHALRVAESYALDPADRVLQLASSSFDVAAEEIYPTWLRGAAVVLAPAAGLAASPASLSWLARERLSVLNLSASFWHQWVEAIETAGAELPPALRLVVVGNEQVSAAHFRRWQRLAGDRVELINAYGPTEATITATLHRPAVGTGAISAGDPLPIGRPIGNVRLEVLNPRLEPVPCGAVGEICLAGAGLARGYPGQPRQTAERFLPRPASDVAGARLYRTGDLGRILADGTVRLVGRSDHQLKVRGFRVEPGEIETVLRAHPEVREAVVAAPADRLGHRRLVAWIETRGTPTPTELREFVAERLPPYMVPSLLAVLSELPRLPGGKIDRRRLPEPELGHAPTGVLFKAPRSAVEKRVAELWSELLGVSSGRIGVDDDFFTLGGHSLLATQVLFRISEAFGTEIALAHFLSQPTVAALAAAMDAGTTSGSGAREAMGITQGASWSELDDVHFPLSFAQQRLWFLDQLVPDSPFYNIFRVFDLAGSVDVAALEGAWIALVGRHTALRTAFVAAAGTPLQRVAPPPKRMLPVVDLGRLARRESEREIVRLGHREGRRPFDLTRTPQLRATLVRVAADHHAILLTLHHIAVDGWSLGILYRDLAALYEAGVRRRPARLPALPIRYADFALWQRRHLRGDRLDDELAYWRRRLAGGPAILELPCDRPRPAVQRFRGARLERGLPADLGRQLRELGSRHRASLFTTLLAGFQGLLSRWSGQEELVVGSPIANRTHPQTEELVGLFANTLALRADLRGAPSFRELLERVRETTVEALSHQDLPFERLVEELQPERHLDHAPLFQVLFVLQNTPGPPFALPGLGISRLDVDNGVTLYDLSVSLEDEPHGLTALARYNTDLFDATTIIRLLRSYVALLRHAAAEPDRPLAQLAILGPAERHQLLVAANDSRTGPPEGTWHHLFAQRAAATPDRIAVVCDRARLSYGELARRVRCLARWLRAAGVGPEVRVGICLDRCLEIPQAILGVLSAGGAYVPLDPAAAPGRLRFMLEDSGVALVLTREALGSDLPAAVASVAVDGTEITADADAIPEPSAASEQLAYVLYTSGSTGRPKGVMVTHRSVVNLTRALGSRVYRGLGGPLRVSLNAPITFDASVKQLVQLLDGHTLCVVPEQVRQDPQRMVAFVRSRSIDALECTPSQLALLLAAGLGHGPGPSPALVLVGGEAIDRAQWEALAALPASRFVNVYGPTEFTVDASAAAIVAHASPTLGSALDNNAIYLLDRRLEVVPWGVAGELCLAGAGLARGYLDRPALTADRFVPDPFAGEPGARLYRTGDRARYGSGGCLQFLGRVDFQVKIRGYRLELGEIEAVLERHPGVGRAVVTVSERAGDLRLVAYLTAADETVPAAATLRAFLREELPDYMVPAVIVPLAELPVNPSGKVDRRTLPDPESQFAAEPAQALPRGDLERTLAGIWSELLGLESVGIHDNFFDLGGHSLLLARLQQQLRQRCGVEIAIVDFFRHPTVSSLARHLDRDRPAVPAPRTAEPKAESATSEIAIIGMAGRFPGAADVAQFWHNLCAGVESIRFFSDEELRAAGVDRAEREHPHYVPAGGVLDDVESFDAEFFGYSPREAEIMDPQQRIFLECSWEALEHAGYDPWRVAEPVGVFAGVGMSTYWLNHVHPNPRLRRSVDPLQMVLLNEKDFLSTRVSYKLNLEGPSISVQTACSSSLVAVHLACRSLGSGECRMALAGGVSIRVPQHRGYLYHDGSIMSPDGHCRAFDAAAAGTVGGNAAALVVLKPLAAAIADGDTIYAVVKGSAVNNDGAHKIGYAAPRPEGQAQVIAEALARAGVEPDTVSYIEAHGTGTPIGDPVEIAALSDVYRRRTERRGFCAVGSLKTNVGHLDTAAGVAGLIKTALALEQRMIPPSLGYDRPNPKIDFARSPFYVNAELRPWTSDGPRRAGVSSFGIGGTNAHVVLEEAPARAPAGEARHQPPPEQILLLSARTESALERASERLAATLAERRELDPGDVAYTLQVGRRAFSHRRMLVCRDLADAADALSRRRGERLVTGRAAAQAPSLVWMFPGQGAQFPRMGHELYAAEPGFRERLDACARRLRPHLGCDLREQLAADGTGGASPLDATRITQPALFAVEVALAGLLMDWGLRPQAMIGHSIGEYAAAWVAGVFTLEDALDLVALRGALMAEMPPGAMLGVALSESELASELSGDLAIAAVNGARQCAVSGDGAAIAALAERLAARGVRHRRLRTSHAFHSPMVEPVVERFAKQISQRVLRAPEIPFISNLTGTWIRPEEATDPAYWAAHLRHTVRFADGLERLGDEAGRLCLEVGPGRTLSTLARQHYGAGAAVVATLPSRRPDRAALLEAVGRLWLAGVEVDWPRLHRVPRRRVALPTYPFERRRYWIEAAAPAGTEAPAASSEAEAGAGEPGLTAYARHPQDHPYAAPEGELEELVAGIWAEILGIGRIDRHDDFFELGGDSMIAAQLVARIRENLEMHLPIDSVFDAPTVAALAQRIEESMIATLEDLPEEEVEQLP